MGHSKDKLLARLKELQIDFFCYDHPVVLTVEDQAKYVGHLGGVLSKNLLLKDKKHRYYIVSALAGTKVDLKILAQRLGLGKGGLRMAPEEALQELLQVPLGCVTPFALVNDSASAVSLMLDQGLREQERCYFHPLSNDATISLSAKGLEKFLTSIGRQPSYVDFEVNPLVGKDNPPDLVSLVPSQVPTLTDPVDNTSVPGSVSSQNNVPAVKLSKKIAEASQSWSNVMLEKAQNTVDPVAEATNIKNLVEKIIDKMSKAFVLEISKDTNDLQSKLDVPAVANGVRKSISSDVERIMMTLKNTAYTEGYHAGLEAVLLGLRCQPSRK